jgi:hypothetical protein
MFKNVIEFDCQSKLTGDLGINRPNFLNTKQHLLNNISLLIKMRPSEDIQVIRKAIKK